MTFRCGFAGEAGESASRGTVSRGHVTTPAPLVAGNHDPAMGRAGVEAGARYMKGPWRYMELDAGHSLTQQQFAGVSEAMPGHVRAKRIGPRRKP
mgnify:FL=1